MAIDICKLQNTGSLPLSDRYQGVSDTGTLNFGAISVPMLCADPHFAITESSTSNRPALAKISSPSMTLSFDKWIKQRWLSIESVLWGKLNKPETPSESPNEVSEERDWNQDFLLRIPLQKFSVINQKQAKNYSESNYALYNINIPNCWINEVTRNVIIYFLKNRGVLFHKNSLEFWIETFIKTGVQTKFLLFLPTRIRIQKAMLSLLY